MHEFVLRAICPGDKTSTSVNKYANVDVYQRFLVNYATERWPWKSFMKSQTEKEKAKSWQHGAGEIPVKGKEWVWKC